MPNPAPKTVAVNLTEGELWVLLGFLRDAVKRATDAGFAAYLRDEVHSLQNRLRQVQIEAGWSD